MQREYAEFFKGKEELLLGLEALNEKMDSIRDAIVAAAQKRRIVISFIGSARAGKTSMINNQFDFLKKCGVSTTILEEPAAVVQRQFRTDAEKKAAITNEWNFNLSLLDHAKGEVQRIFDTSLSNACPNVLLYDRGFVNPIFMMQVEILQMKEKGENIEKYKKQYQEAVLSLREFNQDIHHIVIETHVPPHISLQRDYTSALCLKPRKRINPEGLQKQEEAFQTVRPDLTAASTAYYQIDCSQSGVLENSLTCANLIAKHFGVE